MATGLLRRQIKRVGALELERASHQRTTVCLYLCLSADGLTAGDDISIAVLDGEGVCRANPQQACSHGADSGNQMPRRYFPFRAVSDELPEGVLRCRRNLYHAALVSDLCAPCPSDGRSVEGYNQFITVYCHSRKFLVEEYKFAISHFLARAVDGEQQVFSCKFGRQVQASHRAALEGVGDIALLRLVEHDFASIEPDKL